MPQEICRTKQAIEEQSIVIRHVEHPIDERFIGNKHVKRPIDEQSIYTYQPLF